MKQFAGISLNLAMGTKGKSVLLPSTVKELPKNWQWERLDNVCAGIFDCPHSTPVLTEEGPLIARSQDIRSGVFRLEEAAHISEDTYQDRIRRAQPCHGDLFYSREGTYFGIAAEVPPRVNVCLGQRMVLLRPNQATISHRYLRYWLNSPSMALHIHGFRDGTVAERLNLPTIRGLAVAVPPRAEQRAIASILGALDDKIELNRRMNRTLEAMAQALFQSWFVDFDPVRAKVEGRDPGLPAEIADLFPDGFEESVLGEIPQGWKITQLRDITAKIGSGATPRGGEKVYVSQGVNLIRSQNIYDSEFSWSGLAKISDEEAEKMRGVTVEDEDVLINITGDSILRTWVADESVLPARVNQHVAIIRPKPGIPSHYVHQHLLRPQTKQQMLGLSAGATRNAVTKGHLENQHLLMPDQPVLCAFAKITESQFARVNLNNSISRTLAALRDTLLPKLLSGELRISAEGRG